MVVAWSPRRLRAVGLVTALAVALPAMPGDPSLRARTAWLASLVVFVGLFWMLAGSGCATWKRGRLPAALAALAAAGLALVAVGGGAVAAAYPVLVAAVAGSALGGRAALSLVGAQGLLLPLAFGASGAAVADAVVLGVVFGGLQLFVLHTAQVARAEAAARRELEQAHRRLEAAQQQLAASSRDAERLRIARDLHDVMGHHLTALSLTLEAASHASGAPADEYVAEGLVLTKRLLRDVRGVVSAMREGRHDLMAGLRRLTSEAKGPQVHLALAGGLADLPPQQAHAVLRCAQEAVTNAARHSSAANLWLEVSARDGGLLLRARDDGRAHPPETAAGHGLRGTQERVEELGGWVRWGPAEAGGFELKAWIPPAADAP